MTLLHAVVHRARAFFASDSTGYYSRGDTADVVRWPGGAPLNVCKARAFPNIGCVLLAAGRIGEHARQIVDGAHSFEHAVQRLHELLPAFVVGPGSYLGQPLRQFVALVGPSRDGMCAVQFRSEAGYRPEWTFPQAGGAACVCTPAPVADLSAPGCLDSMAAFARAAIEQARKADAAAPYGGALVVGCVDADGAITMRRAGDLGMPPRRPGADDLVCLPWQFERPPVPSVAQLLYGVATETYADEGSSDSVTVAVDGVLASKVATSRSYTNTTLRTVMVQFECSIFGLYHSAGSLTAPPTDYLAMQWVIEINSTPVLSQIFYQSQGSIPTSSAKVDGRDFWQRELAAGDSITVEVRAIVDNEGSNSSATAAWDKSRLRTSIIKA
ncbi:MAG: hypothetical protein KIT17_15450 [Rubrivivax sp.]|nr:hypothetical protein [Rubrivivax sp.]